MAGGTAIRQTRADPYVCINITHTVGRPGVADARALALRPRELALKDLPAPTNGAKGIAIDDEQGRIGRIDVAATHADFVD